jgi:uncharacterized membrane protein YbaN (DUF454 family)
MKINPSQNKLKQLIYLLLGIIFLVFGILGAMFPVIPGFLFLIPAVFFFAKASKTFNNWIRNNKYFKKYFGEHTPYKRN